MYNCAGVLNVNLLATLAAQLLSFRESGRVQEPSTSTVMATTRPRSALLFRFGLCSRFMLFA
jgi:hypothetical protein